VTDARCLIETEWRNDALWIWLNRPERHNALVPRLMSDLKAAIATAAVEEPVALVLAGRGTSFSTGGDLTGFLDHSGSREALLDYANLLVGTLHEVILDLLAFPAPVLAAVNGPVTGGSTGLVLAADMVAMSERAFLQPYYSDVGFGPDGGWTALLPERVGTSRALQIQYLNERVSASEALSLGLVSSVRPTDELIGCIDGWVGGLASRFKQTHQATRNGVWDEARRDQVQLRLDREKDRFLQLIARAETLAGMQAFTRRRA